jgi:hypothetical protein
MLIHLARLETGPFVDMPVDELETLAAVDRVSEHELTDDSTTADVILFPNATWSTGVSRRFGSTRSFREKVMIYDERDRPWPSFPACT